jgi:hypothetical protein
MNMDEVERLKRELAIERAEHRKLVRDLMAAKDDAARQAVRVRALELVRLELMAVKGNLESCALH